MTERVEDIIVGNFTASRDTLMEVFRMVSPIQLIPMQKILASMRGLPAEAQKEVVIPIIEKISKEMGIDHTTERGHATISEFSDTYALAIQDATQFIIQNMERQQQTAGLLRTGRAGSLM